MEAARPSSLISLCEMYNYLQLSDLLVLDVRPAAAFDELHIKTAIGIDVASFTSLTSEEIEKKLHVRVRPRWKARLYVSRVIIYGDAEADAPATALLVAQLVQLLKLDSAQNRSVVVLNGGMRAFAARYPYLCLPSPPLDANGIPKEVKTQANLVYPAEILEDFLYLGGAMSAHNMDVLINLGITRVIACAAEFVPPFPEKIKYLCVPVDDTPATIIRDHFEETWKYLTEAHAGRERVLVHCAMGISRSTTIVIAFLIRHHKMNLKAAFDYVRARRPSINPNRGFLKQLIDLEVSIYATPTLRLDEAGNRTWL